MERQKQDLYNIGSTPEELQGALQQLRADFDAHNHDGASSKAFQTMTAETVSARAMLVRKTSFADNTSGMWMGLVGNVFKLAIGDATSYMQWTGTALNIVGSISGSTITGGTFQTATSGQRIVIAAADNTLRFFDSEGQVIGIGTVASYAARFNLNATTTTGLSILSSIDATNGIIFESTANVTTEAITILQTNTGSGNDGTGLSIDHRGAAAGSYGIDLNKEGAGTAMRIVNAGSGTCLEIQSNNSSSIGKALSIIGAANGSGDLVDIDAIHTGTALNVSSTNSGAAAGISITHGASGTAALFIDKNNSYGAIEIDQDANNGAACFGIIMNIANAGAGVEYAFDFNGSEIVNSGVGGSQDKKIRIRIGGTDYFVPCHTS